MYTIFDVVANIANSLLNVTLTWDTEALEAVEPVDTDPVFTGVRGTLVDVDLTVPPLVPRGALTAVVGGVTVTRAVILTWQRVALVLYQLTARRTVRTCKDIKTFTTLRK